MIGVIVIGDEIAFFDLLKVLKNSGSVANNEDFVFKTLIRTSNDSGRDEFMVFNSEWFDRSREIDTGYLEQGIADGFDMARGLETDIEINR